MCVIITMSYQMKRMCILLKILVVDDEKEIADLIEVYLKNEGFEVVKCFSGTQALDKISLESYDLAVLDVMLPGMNGFEVAGKARAKGITTPILMLTAKAELDDKHYCLGLAIAKSITESHKGHIEVLCCNSLVEFRVTLPLSKL